MKAVVPAKITDQPFHGARALVGRPLPHSKLVLSVLLWLMVWGTYDAEIWRLFAPGFPANPLDLFHGLRTLLPFIAAYIAIIMLLARRSLASWLFQGPLGLIALYTLVGILSSILLSREPLIAFYWAAQYASVLLVLWAISSYTNPLQRLSVILNLNWIIIAVLALSLLAGIWFLPGASPWEAGGGWMGRRAYSGEFGAAGEMLGMPGTRATGFGRYAAVAALVALAKLWHPKKWVRGIWCVVLLFSLFALVLSQARTAVLSFLAGVFLFLWLRQGPKLHFLAGAFLALLLLGFTGSYQAFWNYLTLGRQFDPTLSGRTGVWQEGWRLFLDSPLLGFGFHADRIFLEWQHMHNALLHALVQTGLLGTIPFVAALVNVWVLIFRFYRTRLPQNIFHWEIPAVMAFFTVESITESTFAFFGVIWLLSAPLLCYITILNRRNFPPNHITFK